MTGATLCSGIGCPEVAPQKTCSRCGEQKALTEFHGQKSGPLGKHSWCKPCYNKARRGRVRKSTPLIRRRANLLRRYGITDQAFEQILNAQGRVCAICRRVPSRPCIDHDHKTGAVRGILCHRCNVFMAALDDVKFLQGAIRYKAVGNGMAVPVIGHLLRSIERMESVL